MKPLTLLLFFVLTTVTTSGQVDDEIKNNSISFESGKNGLVFNLNYDRYFSEKKFGFRIVVGSNLDRYQISFNSGGGIYKLVGKNRRFLELGLDMNYYSYSEISDDQIALGFLIYPNIFLESYYLSMNIGFRAYCKKSLFRIGFSPGVIANYFVPGGYISYGIHF